MLPGVEVIKMDGMHSSCQSIGQNFEKVMLSSQINRTRVDTVLMHVSALNLNATIL